MGLESKKRLVDQVNTDNQTTLKVTHTEFSNPVDVPDSDKSATTVTARPPGYYGSKDIQYRRLGLNHLFNFFQPRISVSEAETEPLTPEVVVERIRERYPVQLSVDEVTVTHEVRADGDYYVVTAKDNSLVYKSSVTVGTRPRDQVPITDVVYPDTVSYVYPNNSANRAYARIYSGGWYLPECHIELSELLVGQKADMNLAWLTTIVSGDTWLLDPEQSAEFNLSGAIVRYNGPMSGINLHPDEGFMLYKFPEATHVVLIELSDTLCTGLVGRLTYYYGVAENDNP